MALRYTPLFLRHSPSPRVEHFALLAGLEASVRGILISVMPVVVYHAMGSAEATSRVYFLAGIASLLWGMCVPWLTGLISRRWTYTLGGCLYLAGMTLAIQGGAVPVAAALVLNMLATVTIFVCLNAYVLDYVQRADLGRSQSVQMLYAAAPWAVGPALGVWLHGVADWLPFAVGLLCAGLLLAAFWVLRLGNGKQIARARSRTQSPVAYLGRFFAQPRLIAGWLFAVVRSCGWWVYVVYLPIFAIEAGLGQDVGGIALSLSNLLLFLTPFLLGGARRLGLRRAVTGAFLVCGALLAGAAAVSGVAPWGTVGLLMAASFFLVVLDVVGGLPFLMAVKPLERTEMAAVYSSFRDVSGIATPGVAYLVLLAGPVPLVFAAFGAAMAGAAAIARRLHPRLGAPRPSRGAGAVSAAPRESGPSPAPNRARA